MIAFSYVTTTCIFTELSFVRNKSLWLVPSCTTRTREDDLIDQKQKIDSVWCSSYGILLVFMDQTPIIQHKKKYLIMTSAQVSDTLVAVTSSSPDYCRPDDHTTQLTLNHTLTPLSLGERGCWQDGWKKHGLTGVEMFQRSEQAHLKIIFLTP